MKQKFIVIIMLFATLCITAQTFPNDKHFYYTNNNRTSLVHLHFFYDQEGDPVCIVWRANSFSHYIWDCNMSGKICLSGFEYQNEVKTQSYSPVFGAPPLQMLTYTGRLIKNRNSGKLYLSNNYGKLEVQNNIYTVRLDHEEYSKLYSQLYGSGSNGNYSSGYGSSSGGYNSNGYNNQSQGYRTEYCKYCNGTGKCNSCHGMGHKANVYSGYEDTCPSCNGNGRCFNCHGSGRQR